jgi:hypothetical protein
MGSKPFYGRLLDYNKVEVEVELFVMGFVNAVKEVRECKSKKEVSSTKDEGERS